MGKQIAQLSFNAWMLTCIDAYLVTALCCTQVLQTYVHLKSKISNVSSAYTSARHQRCNIMATTQQQFFPVL
jgi:hypothetical protein